MLKSLSFKPRRMISNTLFGIACALGLARHESRVWIFRVNSTGIVEKMRDMPFEDIIKMEPEDLAKAMDARTTVHFLISRWHPRIGAILFFMRRFRPSQVFDDTGDHLIEFNKHYDAPKALSELKRHEMKEFDAEISIDDFDTFEYIREMGSTAVITFLIQTNNIAPKRSFMIVGYTFNSKRAALAFKLAVS